MPLPQKERQIINGVLQNKNMGTEISIGITLPLKQVIHTSQGI